jgi:hypothetical protein
MKSCGQAAKTGETRNMDVILIGKPIGKRSLER